jgi:LAO/AO transport system kinase
MKRAGDSTSAQMDPEALAAAVVSGDRKGLARAITLIESARPDHRPAAESLLDRLAPDTGRAVRIGITGAPGVGKSTLIESLGNHLIDIGHSVAVLSVDPSSSLSGGSILGDKTRMTKLAARDEAFIRPSPSGSTLGGVARRTREALLVCEAAGYDVVIVETVGVGQSETAVAEMTDVFVLMLLPGGGDELQGVKKGIFELVDLVLVNKDDGDLRAAAARSVAAARSALTLTRPRAPGWTVPVLSCSALEGSGIVPGCGLKPPKPSCRPSGTTRLSGPACRAWKRSSPPAKSPPPARPGGSWKYSCLPGRRPARGADP